MQFHGLGSRGMGMHVGSHDFRTGQGNSNKRRGWTAVDMIAGTVRQDAGVRMIGMVGMFVPLAAIDERVTLTQRFTAGYKPDREGSEIRTEHR